MRIYKVTKRDLFNILYIVYLVNVILSESQYSSFEIASKLLFVVRIGLLVSFFLLCVSGTMNNRKMVIGLLLLLIIVLNLVFANGAIGLLLLFLITYSSGHTTLEEIFKNTIITMVVMYLFVIVSFKIGIIEDVVTTRWLQVYGWQGSYERTSLGFLNANQVPLALFYVFMLLIFWKRDKMKLRDVAIVLVCNFIVYHYCNSRTPFLLIILAAVAYYAIKILNAAVGKHKINSIYSRLTEFAFPICALLSFVLALAYDETRRIDLIINNIFNNRVVFAHESILYYGIHLLGGGKIAGTRMGGLEAMNVDNAYVLFVLQFGPILFVILLTVLVILSGTVVKKKDRFLMMVIWLIALENLIDANLTSYKMIPFYCILIHQAGLMKYRDKRKTAPWLNMSKKTRRGESQ